ncbi:hypothetical protein AB0I72_20350 [Nocardiopsis sp. NPDC049922]|uniref:hypothetical protein n=1 Tax=Nocardiopsis sp. NPDC049922 TaxID=3155157 RepID=UPI0033F2B8FD
MTWLDTEHRSFETCFRWTRPSGEGSRYTGARHRRHQRAIGYGWRLRRAFSVLCQAGHTRWEAMREATQEAAELALEMGDPLAYAISQLDRAEVASGQGDHDTGHERALTALYVLDHLEDVDDRWLARAHRAAGANLYRRGDLDDGRAEIETAVRIFTDHEDRWWQVRALCNLAEVYRFQGHHVRAFDLLDNAQDLLVGSQNVPEQWARVQLQIGEVLRLRGFALHAWFVLEAEREFTRIGDDWGRWRTCLVLGQVRMAHDRRLGKEEMLRAAKGFLALGTRGGTPAPTDWRRSHSRRRDGSTRRRSWRESRSRGTGDRTTVPGNCGR